MQKATAGKALVVLDSTLNNQLIREASSSSATRIRRQRSAFVRLWGDTTTPHVRNATIAPGSALTKRQCKRSSMHCQ
jgi:hypothetical protein